MRFAPASTIPGGARPGAVLVDLALAVALLGLILAGGLMVAPTVLEKRERALTQSRMDRIEQALLAHLIETQGLPCPADALDNPTPWKAGDCPKRAGAPATASTLYSMGTLPWWELGLMEEDIEDAWGNRITYAVSQGATEGILPCLPETLDSLAPRGAILVLGEDKARPPPDSQGAAYVLISHGANGLGAITAAGVRHGGGPGDNPSEAENRTPSRAADTRDGALGARLHAAPTPTEADAEAYDDLLRWKTPWAMLGDLGCLDSQSEP